MNGTIKIARLDFFIGKHGTDWQKIFAMNWTQCSVFLSTKVSLVTISSVSNN